MQPLKNCIGPTIRIGREILCLPYAGFFKIYCKISGKYGKSRWSIEFTKYAHLHPVLLRQFRYANNKHFLLLWWGEETPQPFPHDMLFHWNRVVTFGVGEPYVWVIKLYICFMLVSYVFRCPNQLFTYTCWSLSVLSTFVI